MPSERKQIRDSIKSIIQSVYSGDIETSQAIAPRDNSYVQVIFRDGLVEGDALRKIQTAQINITYALKLNDDADLPTDDDLDEKSDEIQAAVYASELPDFVSGMTKIGFEYSFEVESNYTTLTTQHQITYRA